MFDSIRSVWHSRIACDGVSYLATDAYAKLTAEGWEMSYEDDFLLAIRGKQIRELPYCDSLHSLVYRDHVKYLLRK